MAKVGKISNSLIASTALRDCLQASGELLHFTKKQLLFQTGDSNPAVFLVSKGEVCLRVEDMTSFDRLFEGGSLLGLPATVTGHPYSLTAICATDVAVLRVKREEFLCLMQEKPEVCREITDLLSREVTFINSALAQRMHLVSR